MNAEQWLGDQCKLVAEIGANHQGDVNLAMRLARMCAEAGVDAVKGQLRDCFAEPPKHWATTPYEGPHSFGATYLAHRQRLELQPHQHEAIAFALRDPFESTHYGVSVWDVRSAKYAAEAPWATWLKVPSACLTDLDLVRVCAESGKVVVLSTGMSTLGEVECTVDHIAGWDADGRLILLHCTSAYPCANEDVHLRAMEELGDVYSLPIGISGHWTGIQIDAAAVALGARLIERHVTLDRTMKGTDHAASLGPGGVRSWVRDVRAVEAAMGEAEIRVLECEKGARAKLRSGL